MLSRWIISILCTIGLVNSFSCRVFRISAGNGIGMKPSFQKIKTKECMIKRSSHPKDTGSLEDWGLTSLQLSAIPGAKMVLSHPDPPMVALPNFLTNAECDEIIALAKEQQSQGREATDYLNHRVNKEISEQGRSDEAASLLVAEGIDEKVTANKGLEATDTGGFRVRLIEADVERMLGERLLRVMGLEERRFRFESQFFVQADPRTVMVRDQTVVHYENGDGVPPHVDGKDATLLVYLSDPPSGGGGRTVFPDYPPLPSEAFPEWPKGKPPVSGADEDPQEDFSCLAFAPKKGAALLYWSDKELLHYSERVGEAPPQTPSSEKQILQLLLDFNYRNANGERNTGGTFVDYETGHVYEHGG
mmetsp:Transcript_47378/g.95463  ORF Transcript_47378/g.95463 Transcript_47378/m.95463 type:complete len:361 (+) Transcript_47378:150-1232(+)